MNIDLSVEDMLDDLHALDRELAAFESKYHVLSEDFFVLYQQGQVEDSLERFSHQCSANCQFAP